MKTIWITGGKGFVGRNLAQYLALQQCRVFGIGHGFWTKQAFQKHGYQYWTNAEIEFSNLDQLASESGLPDVIFHLAGGSAVGSSIDRPYEDFQRTVDTTARLLEWVRKSAFKTKVIGVSSAAVYGAGKLGPIEESAATYPFSPYGFHKHMLENLFQSYHENFDLDVAVVRLFSVYGAGLEKQLLWDICNKISHSTDKEIQLHGSGDELRDWLHISDAVKLLWLIASDNTQSNLFINGGTGVGTKIKEVAKTVIRHWDDEISVNFSGEVRKGDPVSLIANTTLAASLSFKHEVNFEAGVAEVVDWYKARSV